MTRIGRFVESAHSNYEGESKLMKRVILFAVLGLVVIGAGVGIYVMRPTAEASAPIQATPVKLQQDTTAAPTRTPESGAQLLPTSTPAQAAAPTATTSAGGGLVVYQIVQEESSVSFSIDEILRGSPYTAVGKTNQVAGEIAVDFDNAAVQLGVIQVNARTLQTDSTFRDRAIRNEILDTGTYEMITFTPKSIDGLPQSAQPGDEVSVSITGDLTIRNITQEATFAGQVRLVSMDRLEGTVTATVLRSDYQLVIPNVPNVADVSNDVHLEIQFVAVKK
jgi:polyisoprenoid-binding protein YceI